MVPLLPGLSNLNSGSDVGRSGLSGGLPQLVRQVSPFEGTVPNFVCLRNVDLRAKLVPISSEVVFPPSLGTFPTNSKWAFVAKGGKRVLLPDFFFFPLLRLP